MLQGGKGSCLTGKVKQGARPGKIEIAPKQLMDLEERLLDLTGRPLVDGMQGIPEYGIAQQLPITNKVNEAQSTNNEAAPTRTRIEDMPDTPAKKKRKSLTPYLQDIITTKPEMDNCEALKEINEILKTLNKIQHKRLKLKKLELQVQYPEYNFVLSSSYSE